MTYTVVAIREEDGRYSVMCPALNDAGSFGDTLAEALVMATEAIALYIQTLRERGWPVPEDNPHVDIDMSDALEAFVYKLPIREIPEAAAAG